MRPMETAPRDGTRIIVKCVTLAYKGGGHCHPVYGYYAVTGEAWQEIWFDGAKWQPWLGSKYTTSTAAMPDNQNWVLGWQPRELLEETPE